MTTAPATTQPAATEAPKVSEEEQRKLTEKNAKNEAERAADEARFATLFSSEEEGRRRANLTLAGGRNFDALIMEARRRFGAMTHDERVQYLEAQEAMTPEQRRAAALEAAAPNAALLAELTYIKMSNLPIPDALFGSLVGLVKAYEAEHPDAEPKPAAKKAA